MSNKYETFFKMNAASGQEFSVTISNYTRRINGKYPYYHHETETPLQAFGLYNKILADVAGVNIEEIKKTDPILFKNRIPPVEYKKPEIVCIDINGAYFQAALNMGYISEATYNRGLRGSKQARLIALGMLASRKTTIYYKGTEPINYTVKENPTSPIFFDIMNNVGLIMTAAAEYFREYFLFFWFDGIYFKPGIYAPDVVNFLEDNGFKSKIELLKNFSSKQTRDYHLVQYEKEGKKKRFFVPLLNSTEQNKALSKELITIINNKKNVNVENVRPDT